MKKYMKIISLSLILIAFVSVFIYKGNIAKSSISKSSISKSSKEVKISANFVNQKNTIKDIIDSSSLIVVGTVKNSNIYEFQNVVFTNYTISIENKIKTSSNFNLGNQIDIRLTGGNFKGVEYTLEDSKNLNIGDTYLFMLQKTYPENKTSNEYTPIGAYQGIILLDKISGKFKEFNTDNIIEKDLINKNLQDSDLKNITNALY